MALAKVVETVRFGRRRKIIRQAFFWLLTTVLGMVTTNTACTRQPYASTGTSKPQAEATVGARALSNSETKAIANLTRMVSEQFSVYGTQAQFAQDSNLRGGVPPADQHYSYAIAQVTPTKVYITATAQQPTHRSLSAQIFVLPAASRAQAYQNSPISGSLCVTNTPSQVPPAAPGDATVAEPPCPSGSFSFNVLYPQRRK